MNKNRLEAFSDGVIAIIITIMVLELKVPHSSDISSLQPLAPVFLCYVLSFIYVGIYWSNHHHLLQLAKHVTGGILWANTHLLFWLSLVPFFTAWMGENHFAPWTVFFYGVVLLMASIAYFILSESLKATHPKDAVIHQAIGSDRKGKLSTAIYILALAIAYWLPLVALGLFFAVALIWLVPDRRVERVLVK